MRSLVEVWLVRTDLPARRIAQLEPVLDGVELARADALRWAPDRRRFVAAHGALRHIVAVRLGINPEQVRWRRGPHGKPELVDGPQVNLSHSGGLAMVAVGGERPLGVDVEELSARLRPVPMAARFYPPEEAAYVAEADSLDRFVRLWVRKEACAKAAGGRLGSWLGRPVRQDVVPGPFRLTDLPAPAGFRAAVAVAGDGPYRMAVRRWAGATIPAVDAVATELAAMLTAVTGERSPIVASTRLEQDLRLESIEVAALAERVHERWGVDLAAFYAGLELDEIISLTVGDLAFHVSAQVEN